MGTSKSYGGPGDRPPLLPDWAFPDGGAPPQPPPIPPNRPWQAAKRNLGKVASGDTSVSAIKRAGSSYVAAKGGSESAARTARSASTATVSIGSFLSEAATGGVKSALTKLGLSSLAGKPPLEVIVTLIDAFSPPGTTPEEAVTRSAVADALWMLFDRLDLGTEGLDALSSMSENLASQIINTMLAAYIYNRWIQEIGVKLEERAKSSKDSVKIQNEIKQFIVSLVELKIPKNVFTIDWLGKAGKTLTAGVLSAVYSAFDEV